MSVVVRHADARAFRARAEGWLLEREAENNLILGLARTLEEGDHPYGDPIWLATVERDGAVVGCGWRTPPHKVGLTRMPIATVPAVAEAVGALYPRIPGVMAEASVAAAFARAWSELRGVESTTGMRMRIHRLDRVAPPADPAPGVLRRARDDGAEPEALAAWWEAFDAEADVGVASDPLAAVRRRIARGDLWVWEEGGRPVSMAGAGSRTPNGVRVGPVYTPPDLRRKGYATTLVAELSRRLLEEGSSVCFLYTDLDNPTSNAIYASVGYRPVADVVDVRFG